MTYKKKVILISAIFAIMISLLFIVIQPITALFLISYLFALIGIGSLCAMMCNMIERSNSYPWIAALPKAALTYLIVSFGFSTITVLAEQLIIRNQGTTGFLGISKIFQNAPGLYLTIHIVLLLLFGVRIILLYGGQEYIEKRNHDTNKKVLKLGILREELQTLQLKVSDGTVKKELNILIDAIRYSDPMSSADLLPLEEEIRARIQELSNSIDLADAAKQIALIQETSHLLEKRNEKCKLLK